ncbi:MAG: hypothetical protein VXZ82_25385 [Planctomycetota bacterium]|nr:hypothetical protein [Planctomycetota bacterium]
MHALTLIDVANSLTCQAEVLLRVRAALPKSQTHDYWLACRNRHSCWMESLAEHKNNIRDHSVSSRQHYWFEIVPTLQEILLCEVLTRCVAHQACLLEEQQIDTDFAPLAQSAFSTHIEARNRCLNLIVFGTGLPTGYGRQLNRLRKFCEIVSDQLLAGMHELLSGEQFAFEPDATSKARQKLFCSGVNDRVVRLHCTALSSWFLRQTALDIDYRKANPARIDAVADAVAGLLPAETFDSFGLPLTNSFCKLQASTDEDVAPGASVGKFSSPLDILSAWARHEITEFSDKRF